MGKSLQELLAPRMFTGVYETVVKGVPKILPDQFYVNPSARKVLGDQAQYFKVTGSRQSANTSSYGGEPRAVQGEGLSKQSVVLLHAFEKYRHNVMALQGLINPQNEEQQRFYLGEIDRQSMNFAERFMSLRCGAVHSAIANGKIWIGATGQLLTSSSGAMNTIDYSILEATASASWATTTTDIVAHLEEKKREQLQRGRPPFRHAIFGKKVAGYILANASAQGLIRSTPALADAAYRNTSTIPSGFAGLNWIPADGAFHVSGSTVTEWFDSDKIIFLPELSPTWYETMEGSYLVPTTGLNIGSDAAAHANASFDTVYGMFGWCARDDNQPSIVQYGGDTFLPVIRDGSAVLRFETT